MVKNSKWSVLRCYHVLRHSFVSNLAAPGTHQQVIDELMGHTTEDMRRCYRHLFPDPRLKAVLAVFGDDPAGEPKARPEGTTNAGPT